MLPHNPSVTTRFCDHEPTPIAGEYSIRTGQVKCPSQDFLARPWYVRTGAHAPPKGPESFASQG